MVQRCLNQTEVSKWWSLKTVFIKITVRIRSLSYCFDALVRISSSLAVCICLVSLNFAVQEGNRVEIIKTVRTWSLKPQLAPPRAHLGYFTLRARHWIWVLKQSILGHFRPLRGNWEQIPCVKSLLVLRASCIPLSPSRYTPVY